MIVSNILCDVPEDLFKRCFLPFWNIQEAIQLDMAVNNRAIRDELSEKLKGHCFTSSRPFRMDLYAWALLTKRDYYVDNYYIPSDSLFSFIGAWSKAYPHVKTICIADRILHSSDSLAENYLNQCTNLSRLDLRNVTDKSLTLFNGLSPQLLSRLTWLSVEKFRYMDARCLPKIADNCVHLQHLDLSGSNLYMNAVFAECIARLVNLRYLGVGYCEVTNELLSVILAGCTQLTSLDLSGCIEITDTGVGSIAQSLSALKVLKLAHCYLVTDEALLSLAVNCQGLEELNLENCQFLTDRSLVATTILCKKLRSINLSKVPEITNTFLLSACELTHLSALDLSNNENITDELIILLTQSRCARNFISLNLAWCVNLTDASVLAIAERCVNLQHLNLDSSLQAVEGPVGLEVGGRTLVSAASVAVLAARCVHLVSLNVANVIGMDDATVAAIAQHCTKLHSLNLYGCNLITNAAIVAITGNCSRLRTLNISCCGKVTALADIHSKCPYLEFLNIKRCTQLENVEVYRTVRKCTNLKEINMQGCEKIGDMVVMACEHLRRVNIAECPRVTDHAVETLVRHSTVLKNLNVSRCAQLSGKLINYLLSAMHVEIDVSIRQLMLSHMFNHPNYSDSDSEEGEEPDMGNLLGTHFFDDLIPPELLATPTAGGDAPHYENIEVVAAGGEVMSIEEDSGEEEGNSASEAAVNLSGAGAFSSEEDEQIQ